MHIGNITEFQQAWYLCYRNSCCSHALRNSLKVPTEQCRARVSDNGYFWCEVANGTSFCHRTLLYSGKVAAVWDHGSLWKIRVYPNNENYRWSSWEVGSIWRKATHKPRVEVGLPAVGNRWGGQVWAMGVALLQSVVSKPGGRRGLLSGDESSHGFITAEKSVGVFLPYDYSEYPRQ